MIKLSQQNGENIKYHHYIQDGTKYVKYSEVDNRNNEFVYLYGGEGLQLLYKTYYI